jgi:hypothetical protein
VRDGRRRQPCAVRFLRFSLDLVADLAEPLPQISVRVLA